MLPTVMQGIGGKLGYRFPELFIQHSVRKSKDKQGVKQVSEITKPIGQSIIEHVNEINKLHWEMFSSVEEIEKLESLNVESYYAMIFAFIQKREAENEAMKRKK